MDRRMSMRNLAPNESSSQPDLWRSMLPQPTHTQETDAVEPQSSHEYRSLQL
jgi:hypothetical protein